MERPAQPGAVSGCAGLSVDVRFSAFCRAKSGNERGRMLPGGTG